MTEHRHLEIALERDARTARAPRLNPKYFGDIEELLDSAAMGRRDILLVACSDQGTAPDNVSILSPDQLFVVQSMGACIPASDDFGGVSTLASIEYAVRLGQVRHIVVCGHLDCRILPYWLTRCPPERLSEEASAFLRTARSIADSGLYNANPKRRLHDLIRAHILVQLENLQSHEFIHDRLNDGALKLHAWLVDDRSARVYGFDAANNRFGRLLSRTDG